MMKKLLFIALFAVSIFRLSAQEKGAVQFGAMQDLIFLQLPQAYFRLIQK